MELGIVDWRVRIRYRMSIRNQASRCALAFIARPTGTFVVPVSWFSSAASLKDGGHSMGEDGY